MFPEKNTQLEEKEAVPKASMLRADSRVSTVSWMGMKPTGKVSLTSMSFMSTSTFPR